jgi:hypothetical protein
MCLPITNWFLSYLLVTHFFELRLVMWLQNVTLLLIVSAAQVLVTDWLAPDSTPRCSDQR